MLRTSASNGPLGATWADGVKTLRPSSSSETVCAAGRRSMCGSSLPARPITTGSMEGGPQDPSGGTMRMSRSAGALEGGGLDGAYDSSKHSWAHPLARAEQKRLASSRHEPGSWAWSMFKARNHTGYGVDGMVDRRDVQSTAVSGDGPEWFVGTRTVTGPMSTKKYPVRRCPFVEIEGKELKVRPRTFKREDDLGCTATLHDRLPTQGSDARLPKSGEHRAHRARQAHLRHGGCEVTE
eukprot:CAMPEP_0204524834 /NCGR_PEP_ID=MMETSP0661-20131031/7583_1 /ASSEMBLY_ACC=CAM_ASM_000606 /TAXON_ID=109239 /ORGANISM="Alexandrium margalefi, Strain AMGDE01CS-322" /LENGTH=237 /DNA_ID=CAMNT_0051530601 /DNA_START=1 /DNA_END=714 /DNA_ORIENTATION=-